MITLITTLSVSYLWGVIGLIIFFSYGNNVFNKNFNKKKKLMFLLAIGPFGWFCLLLYILGYLLGKSTRDKNNVL